MSKNCFFAVRRLVLMPVLVMLVFSIGVAEGGEVPKKYLHGQRIAELEAQGALDETERLTLGWHHQRLSRLYADLALSAALLNVDQARCYMADSLVDWCAEYFGAQAMLELGQPERVQDYRFPPNGRPTAPRPLVRLTGVLQAAAGAARESAPNWHSFQPRSYWDSLEAGYQAARLAGDASVPALPIDSARSVEAGVDAAPLLYRLWLAQLIAEGNRDELRTLLSQWEESALPLWRIAAPDRPDTAEFVDPVLPRLMAEGHLILAEDDYARALEKLADEDPVDYVLDRWLEVCFARGDQRQAARLLEMGAPGSRPVYRGWVAWVTGDTTAALTYWQSCLNSDDYRVTTRLLRVWTEMPVLQRRAETLAASLLADLGDLKARGAMRKSVDGRQKLRAVYRSVGAWYFARGFFGDASKYYEQSRVTQERIWLDLYPLDHCSEYFVARTFSGRVDLRQGAYASWMELKEYFPNVQSVALPLRNNVLCESRKHRE